MCLSVRDMMMMKVKENDNEEMLIDCEIKIWWIRCGTLKIVDIRYTKKSQALKLERREMIFY